MLKQGLLIRISIAFTLLISCFSTQSCNSSSADNTSCDKNVQLLNDQIRMKDQRIAMLEDSLQKMSKGLVVTDTASSNEAGAAFVAMEQSLYKKGKNKSTHAVTEIQKKYPGEFPEGSARMLTDKDLKFLSQWGLKVMLNEIYARHGMTFTDETLQKHFNHSNWYHGTTASVDNKLTAIEKHNIKFIQNYKFNPTIPT
jgi:hypothetical protein